MECSLCLSAQGYKSLGSTHKEEAKANKKRPQLSLSGPVCLSVDWNWAGRDADAGVECLYIYESGGTVYFVYVQ